MISTILAEYPWLTDAGFALVLVMGLLVGRAVVDRPRVAWALAGVGVVSVLALTLIPDDRPVAPGCMVGGFPALTAPEPLADVLLLVPPVLLAGVASRRPLVALGGGAALAAAIEAVQAVSPALGRSCSSDDRIANAAGSVVGAATAAVVLLARRRRTPRRTPSGGVSAGPRSAA